MSIRIGRRGFLKFTAGSAVGLATAGITLRGISELNSLLGDAEVRVPTGPEEWKPGICGVCAGGCGLQVRTVGDRTVRVVGNPLHPVNQGGLCPKGIASLQVLYHPDRLRKPLKNTGTKSSPRWREVSWEEAISTTVERLTQVREREPHAFAIIERPEQTLRSQLLREFLAAYGSPNHLTTSSGMDALQTAVFLQQGVTGRVGYDLENTRYLLSFGANLLEGWGAPVAVMRAFSRWRDGDAGSRAKFVQVEPRFSPTAAKADEWVAIRPGTEAALALGLAYVLISEGLYDAEFVRERTFGFEDWKDSSGKSHIGLRSLVMSEYRLNTVAEITGVPAETILRLGREFARHRPAVALGDRQTSTLTGHPFAAMAVHSLNALVGSIDVPGGVLVQPESPVAPSGAAGRATASRLDRAPDHTYLGHHISHWRQAPGPYQLRAVMLNEVNPVFSEPDGARFAEALRAVPFVVSFTPFMDESSALADLVLPAATALERWQASGTPPGFTHLIHAIAPPVAPACHESRDPADVILSIARALGGEVAAALPYEDFGAYLRAQVDRLFRAQTGATFAPPVEQAWDRLLEASGWWAPAYKTADELWMQMKERGGWWEPTYYYGEWDRVLQTRSRRFEFFSQELAAWRKQAQPGGPATEDDRLCLPHQPALASPTSDYPLLLAPIETLPLAGGEGGHIPYLQQIAGQHLHASWESWLEINPQTAARFDVSDGDSVWVESRRGRVRVRARLYPGVRPGMVHLPLGYGHTEGPQWGRRGVNPLTLIEPEREPIAGLPQALSMFVKIYH